jgi:short-subunit dehydrogenase
VAVSSVQGKIGIPFRSAYAASKHALHGFFDSARFELEKQGIAVTLVCPGTHAPFI